MTASELNVLRQYQKGALDQLSATLLKKSEFIKGAYQKELTEALMKKLQIEEDHINKCLEYIEKTEKLFKEMESALLVKQKVIAHFYSEEKEYVSKYYDFVDKLVEESIKPSIEILYGSPRKD
jgi:hypothetical protein